MPSMPAKMIVTGLTSTFTLSSVAGSSAFTWYPDPYVRPFVLSIATQSATSTSTSTYNVEFTQDYLGGFSSNFNGFISSNANWVGLSGLVGITSVAVASVTSPISAIRLNVTLGSSQAVNTLIVSQAG